MHVPTLALNTKFEIFAGSLFSKKAAGKTFVHLNSILFLSPFFPFLIIVQDTAEKVQLRAKQDQYDFRKYYTSHSYNNYNTFQDEIDTNIAG